MANIREVAIRAGVAACTVSRVLNSSGYVSQEKRFKIEQAMKDLNYVPNELARSMFRKHSGIIAMIVPNIKHPFFSSLADSIEKELYKQGYKFMLCSSAQDIEREKAYIEMLKSNLVDGIILGTDYMDIEFYKNIEKPILLLDIDAGNDIPVVVSNHEKGGKLAAKVFIENKCKCIADITGGVHPEVLSYSSHINLRNELSLKHIEVLELEVAWTDFNFDKYFERAKEILIEYPKIDGVFAADMVAAAFLKASLYLGKKIPNEFKVIAYDGTYITNGGLMNITCIVQNLDKIAKEAVKNICYKIEGKIIKKRISVVDIVLRYGETT